MTYLSTLQAPLPDDRSRFRHWGNLQGCSDALSICAAAERHHGMLLVLVPDNLSVSQLARELRFFGGRKLGEILTFPDREILPYDRFSTHQDLISQRLRCLHRLPRLNKGVLICAISTALYHLPPPEFLAGHCFAFQQGEALDMHAWREQLQHSGYQAVSQVLHPGEYSVRGAIFDIFPMGSQQPFRLDLFDEDIDSIRTFDPETQRSLDQVAQITLLPAREFPLTDDSIRLFRQQWRAQFAGNPADCPIYQDISQGLNSAGAESYLPLFFTQTATLAAYLPEHALICHRGDTVGAAERFWQQTQRRYEQYRHDRLYPLLPPEQLLERVDGLFGQWKAWPQIRLHTEPVESSPHRYNCATTVPPSLPVNHRAQDPLSALKKYLAQAMAEGTRVLLCVESPGRREALLDLCQKYQLFPHVVEHWAAFLNSDVALGLTVGGLDHGLVLTQPKLAVIVENQLFGEHVQQRRQRKAHTHATDALVRNLSELQLGAPVVHIDHGVGRYAGLQTLTVQEQPAEFLMLEYANEAKLYVPVSALDTISRYSGADPEHAPLHILGTDHWQKQKKKALDKARDVAAELLDIYARRAAKSGYAFQTPDEQYLAFCQGFPFEETTDQAAAIAATLKDMTSPRPMDRLICGDVGFGKTEVAMRAAFVAVQSHQQVAILVPTTLLAQQHYENFRDRFADWPINVAVLSRFLSKAEQTKTLSQLASGQIDIIIGTHKLIQPDVIFQQLGLVIIDEEHRFGVRQKEQLKRLRADVDMLALTATPIPRTLNMALSGTRDLSVIATPPDRRLSIKTFVREFNRPLIQEAITRELARGGQVYFLHNAVETIDKTADELRTLMPEARIAVAHGQMRESELEKVMSDFYHRRYHVLVCTTIIETGIDIPTANTILIHRADKFGVAQLHQLRGRVGRSHHQAYAYLLTPPPKQLSNDAQKRLDALAALEELGVGFTLATHDLEIRGAGEFLGDEQSGHLQTIGYQLYMEILERTVKALQAGKEPALETTLEESVEINLQLPALIPESYLPDVHLRLVFYKRIASATTETELHELQVEMVDRFGLLPEPCRHLFRIAQLKQMAKALGIRKIDATAEQARIWFSPQPHIDPGKLIQMIQLHPKRYRLQGSEQLQIKLEQPDAEPRFQAIEMALSELSPEGVLRPAHTLA